MKEFTIARKFTKYATTHNLHKIHWQQPDKRDSTADTLPVEKHIYRPAGNDRSLI